MPSAAVVCCCSRVGGAGVDGTEVSAATSVSFSGIRPELIDGLVMAPLWLLSNNRSKPERQPDLHISPRCWEISEILEFKSFNESACIQRIKSTYVDKFTDACWILTALGRCM